MSPTTEMETLAETKRGIEKETERETYRCRLRDRDIQIQTERQRHLYSMLLDVSLYATL